MTSVKEDCVLDDETGTVGTATIHVQDVLINQIKSGNTYETENLTVKQFQGITHLGTTRATTYREANQKLKTLNGPALLKKLEKEVGRLR